MSETPAFELACSLLEESGALDRLAARGTVRLALKNAGLDAKSVTGSELAVVATRLLPAELETRGVADPAGLCARIAKAMEGAGDASRADSPEAVFARLGGS